MNQLYLHTLITLTEIAGNPRSVDPANAFSWKADPTNVLNVLRLQDDPFKEVDLGKECTNSAMSDQTLTAVSPSETMTVAQAQKKLMEEIDPEQDNSRAPYAEGSWSIYGTVPHEKGTVCWTMCPLIWRRRKKLARFRCGVQTSRAKNSSHRLQSMLSLSIEAVLYCR